MKPCRKGHVSRKRKDGSCAECHKIASLAWRAANAAKMKTWDKPCRRGHLVGRYASGACIQCAKDRAAIWGKQNPDKRKDIVRRYSVNHADKVRQRLEEWNKGERGKQYKNAHYQKHRGRYMKANVEWGQKNRERKNEIARNSFKRDLVRSLERRSINKARRLARQRGAGGSFKKSDIDALIIAQNGRCNTCSGELRKYHIDHIIPVSRGGHTNPSNLQLLCPTCNLSKGAKVPC